MCAKKRKKPFFIFSSLSLQKIGDKKRTHFNKLQKKSPPKPIKNKNPYFNKTIKTRLEFDSHIGMSKKKKEQASNECKKEIESRTCLFQMDSQKSRCLRKLLESDLSHTEKKEKKKSEEKLRRVERLDSNLWSFPLFFTTPKILKPSFSSSFA